MVSDSVQRFIEAEGHRVEVTKLEENGALAEIVFRTRGQMFSVAVSEAEPSRFSLSTAYEVPDWVRERSVSTTDTLADIEAEYPGTRFMLAQDGTIFVATLEYETTGVDEFMQHFWQIVGRLRDAGNTAVERMVDHSESKAAADKFIREFMKGER
jgi:hypothetical protein